LNRHTGPVDLRIDYEHELNEQQYAAVSAPDGPALVIAGAGAGKTRTLTYRVAWLLEHGVPADRILLLTFTNKAAKEMMTRVGDLLGNDVSELWGGTFHSVGNRILRRHATLLGWERDFSILDREDSKELLKACIDDAQIDVKETRFPKADVLLNLISLAHNMCKTVGEILSDRYPYFQHLLEHIEAVQTAYVLRKQSTNSMDFDDLLIQWLRLLMEHDDVRELYQRRFRYILVDEYQDTNQVQGDVIDTLAEAHRNLMVVGDDAQSIYSWRGANFRNILNFPNRFEGAVTYKIETNYRSTPEILTFANAAISANVDQFEKELASFRAAGIKPAVVSCNDAHEQAAFVAQRALELRDEGIPLEEMAILYRAHFHATELQFELTKRNIPFSITSGIRFFEQAHVKDVTAWLKLICNPRDELAFKRLVRMLPGVGGKTADKLWRAFLARRSNGEEAQLVPAEESEPLPPGLAPDLVAIESATPKKAKVAWAQFVATMSQAEAEPVRFQPDQMILLIIEAGYQDYLQENFENFESRLDDVKQLAAFAAQFEGLDDFLSQLALLTNVDSDPNSNSSHVDEDDEKIRLSSIHQAKGLEFKVVFVIMLCDGLFPSHRTLEEPEGLEEERRLFYVAVTRAKDELYLCYPFMRYLAGSGDAMQEPSRFLNEIPPDMTEDWKLHSADMPF
jgi:DNA helicase-2/ATP-dependent DNA helicase PcrA